MTKLRAFHGALACGAVSLAMGGTVHAAVANYMIAPGSLQSNVDNACVGALPGATGEDCTYNASNPAELNPDPSLMPPMVPWVGPVYAAGYYAPGTSPFVTLPPVGNELPAAPVPDPNKVELAVTGVLQIDDVNGTECDGDDTIEARFELAAGTRTFSGGPGTYAEETWGDNTIVYVLNPSVPDSQTSGAQGCEYIFGNQGFPTLIQTMGLSPAGVQTYPVDLSIGAAPLDPNDGDEDVWAGPEPAGIGVGTFEGAAPGFDGNTGVAVSLDLDNFFGPSASWQCVDNFGNVNAPTAQVANGQCEFSATAPGTPCTSSGSHFCGVRGVGDPNFNPAVQPNNGAGQENWIIRIVVNTAGDITEGSIFANNESVVFAVQPAPAANNSWDGPVINFTAPCLDCSVAKDDTYTFVTGTDDVVALPIGANDDPNNELDNANTLLTIDPPGPQRGVCTLTGTNPGDVKQIGCSYDSNDGFASAGQDVFMYTLDDSIADPALGLTATVTVNVETDTAPVANAYTIDFDSQGVAPATLRNTTDALTDNGNASGNDPTVTTDNTQQFGMITVSGADITYAADADFFQGMDTFGYTITDDNFGSPGVGTEAVTAQVTVTIPNVLPTASDGSATIEQGETVDVVNTVTLGNGSISQHVTDGDCDAGTITVGDVTANGAATEVDSSYTAPVGFAGDVICVFTITDEDGNGDTATGTISIDVTNTVVVKFPGAGSALDPSSLALMLLVPLLRRRRYQARPERPAARKRPVATTTVLVISVLLICAAATVNAAMVTLKLTNVRSFSDQGAGFTDAILDADGGDWTYDDVAQTVSASSQYTARYMLNPNTRLFTHEITGYVLDVTGASAVANATTYVCDEGTFGGLVGANLCGNYTWGPNFINESEVSWGPGTATSKSLNTTGGVPNGGDDTDAGPIQAIDQNDGFKVDSWDGQTLVISNAVLMSPRSGYTYTLVKPAEAVDDPNYAVSQGSSNSVLNIGANDVGWSPNPTVVDAVSGTATGTGSSGGTFTITSNPDIVNVTASYTPVNAMFTGTETWVYRVTDTEGPLLPQSDTATVTVTASASGTANNDTGATPRLRGPATILVGQNDVGFTDPSTVTITSDAMQGTTVVTSSPGPKDAVSVTYTSTAPLYSAAFTDMFTYQITDGTNTDTADVTVTINNTIPVAGDLNGVTLDTQGVSPSDASVDVNVADGGDIPDNSLGDAPVVITTTPSNDVTSSVAGAIITITAATFTSAGDAVGYTIVDADTEEATGTINVTIPNVTPQVANVTQTITVPGPTQLSAAYQLGNGTANDHTATASAAQWGTVSGVEIDSTTGTIDFDYTPTGFAEIDTFTIDMTDGDGSVGSGTVTVTISGDAVTIEKQDSLPGNGNAVGPASLGALLLGIPLLRARRRNRKA